MWLSCLPCEFPRFHYWAGAGEIRPSQGPGLQQNCSSSLPTHFHLHSILLDTWGRGSNLPSWNTFSHVRLSSRIQILSVSLLCRWMHLTQEWGLSFLSGTLRIKNYTSAPAIPRASLRQSAITTQEIMNCWLPVKWLNSHQIWCALFLANSPSPLLTVQTPVTSNQVPFPANQPFR